ncbi:F-box/kelch-repeat protein At3g23880 [Medicago truncatula]|uniref:F-box and associated interaction domain protein n=2 Tax=Medicago truncatula TaxID=3880 RepID=G7IVE3_MEDTR|nr:F-box/kelch-repeat protein At3g23880 [Medicago truncatula]AES68581.1 F-box and associated interaction domain protein [Medicago truncatula]
MVELTAINKQFLCVLPTLSSSGHSLYDPPLPTLPFDLVAEILCRLPVKLLLQLRCFCKSWNSLITDHKFAKKHLSLSTTRCLHCVSYTGFPYLYVLKSYPLGPVLNNLTTNITEYEYSPYNIHGDHPRLCVDCFVGSCNGILCFTAGIYKISVILWNPSIRKIKEFPLFQKPNWSFTHMAFGFGYDSFNDNYKVVVVLQGLIQDSSGNIACKTEVKVHTSITNCWKNIQEFTFGSILPEQSGKFVSDTINWLAVIDFDGRSPRFIISFDLEKESYQKVLLPDSGGVNVCNFLALFVLRDCLCVTYGDSDFDSVLKDVWIMKEYGNKDSWTKLFTLSCRVDRGVSHISAKPVYLFEDDQVLLKLTGAFNSFVYDSRSGTLKSSDFQNILGVSVESLISPCS